MPVSCKALFVANTGFSLFNFRLPLMKYLARQGWEVVAVASDEADFKLRFAHEGFRFVDILIDHKGRNPISDTFLLMRLRTLYKRERPDLVHHFTIKPVIFGSLAARFAHVPAIVNTVTGLGYAFQNIGLLRRLVILLYKVALSGRVRVIFQNKDDHSFFLSKGIIEGDKGRVILGSGIDTKTIYPNSKNRNKKGRRFVLVSRMLWPKGVAEFVRASEALKKSFPETQFIMAGGPSGGGAQGNPHAIPQEWLRGVNKNAHVKWIGRVPPEEVMCLLDQSDAFILPSYYPEGIPRSLLEAAAKGKAIITTDTPGCREVVEDGVNGFLVPPMDVEALAERMIEFIRQPQLARRMGAESRRRAEELFDERIVFSKTALVYKDAGAL